MKTNIKNVTNGRLNGKIVWICDLRFRDYSDKPIRRIKPTKVMVNCNSNTKKRIYYSESHFVALNKDLQVIKSKVWGVFDNTGHRTYKGEPLEVFDTESECRKRYEELVNVAVEGLNRHLESMKNKINSFISEIKEVD
jgi:hypothetical protein